MSVGAQAECKCKVLWLLVTDRDPYAGARRRRRAGPTNRPALSRFSELMLRYEL